MSLINPAEISSKISLSNYFILKINYTGFFSMKNTLNVFEKKNYVNNKMYNIISTKMFYIR